MNTTGPTSTFMVAMVAIVFKCRHASGSNVSVNTKIKIGIKKRIGFSTFGFAKSVIVFLSIHLCFANVFVRF